MLSSQGGQPSSDMGASATPSPTTCCPRLLIHAGGPGCARRYPKWLSSETQVFGRRLGTWRPGDGLFCFHFPKVITLAEKGGCGESPLILLKAEMWLMIPDDEPLARDGTHCPKAGDAMFARRLAPLIKRMLN